MPFLAAYRYKPSGLDKRADWEHTWALQRREDAGHKLDSPIPVPPKYKPTDFILADAKDPDYAFGVKGTGAHDYLDQSGKHRSIPDFRQTIRDIVKQKQMDVMLGAVSNMEPLAAEGLFEKSAVTPAIRANDTTDIWLPRSGSYSKRHGKLACSR